MLKTVKVIGKDSAECIADNKLYSIDRLEIYNKFDESIGAYEDCYVKVYAPEDILEIITNAKNIIISFVSKKYTLERSMLIKNCTIKEKLQKDDNGYYIKLNVETIQLLSTKQKESKISVNFGDDVIGTINNIENINDYISDSLIAFSEDELRYRNTLDYDNDYEIPYRDILRPTIFTIDTTSRTDEENEE